MAIEFNGFNANRPDGLRRQDDNKTSASTGPAAAEGTAKQAPNEAAKQEVNVNLSSAAKEMSQLESQLNALPDIDQDKVAAIKASLDNGTYQINPASVAQNMLKMES